MIAVGRLEDFPERSVTVVRAGRVEVGIVRWDGDAVYALRNVCPHAGGPVCAGRLGPKVVAAAPGRPSLAVDQAAPVIACAWHGWEFDVRTGEAVASASPHMRVRTYPVSVEAGEVRVGVGRSSGA